MEVSGILWLFIAIFTSHCLGIYRKSRYKTSFLHGRSNVFVECRNSRNVSILDRKQFHFDPSKAKKQSKIQKSKQKKSDDELLGSMRGLADLGIEGKTSQDTLLGLELQNFMAKALSVPTPIPLPSPAAKGSPEYDALLYFKGLPFDAAQEDILNWLSKYNILYVTLIKDQQGYFTGDCYVRCADENTRDAIYLEMQHKTLGTRYIQIFRTTESAYEEYYKTGFRPEPAKRNYIAPKVLVCTSAEIQNPEMVPLESLKCGHKITGTVTDIYRNGVMVDCNVFHIVDGIKERVYCVLKKNRIAKNIGIIGQDKAWLSRKQLVLYPGIKLNLYVEKIRQTCAHSPFDQDIWREHFAREMVVSENVANSGHADEDSTADTNELRQNESTRDAISNVVNLRPLVYLTMDSSVSEDKIKWWEERLLSEHSSETDGVLQIKDQRLQFQAAGSRWIDGFKRVRKADVFAGRQIVFSNAKVGAVKSHNDRAKVDTMQSTNISTAQADNSSVDEDSYLKCATKFFEDCSTTASEFHGFDGKPYEADDDDDDDDNDNDNTDNDHAHAHEEQDPTIVHHNVDISHLYRDLILSHRQQALEQLKALPRTTLFDPAIELPGYKLILRQTDVPGLTDAQVIKTLQVLNVTPTKGPDAAMENRKMLIETIKTKGLGTGLDPHTLIKKKLYKVRQSKRKMKSIITLTKPLTGRRFSQEDLDTASKQELQMLAQEGLDCFYEWDPPHGIKMQFIQQFKPMLGDIDVSNEQIIKAWETLRFEIVVRLYGKQSDLQEIIKALDESDKFFGLDKETAQSSFDVDTLLRLSGALPQVTQEALGA